MAYDAVAFLRARDAQLCEVWVLGDLEHLREQLGRSLGLAPEGDAS